MLGVIKMFALEEATEKKIDSRSYDTNHLLGNTEMQFASIYAVARSLNASLEEAESLFNIIELGIAGNMTDREVLDNQNRVIEEAFERLDDTNKPTFLHVNYDIKTGEMENGAPAMAKHWSVVALTKDQTTGIITITDINTQKEGSFKNDKINGVKNGLIAYAQENKFEFKYQDHSVDRQSDNCCGISVAFSEAEVMLHLVKRQPIETLSSSQQHLGKENDWQARYSAFSRGMYSVLESIEDKDFNKPILDLEISALRRNEFINERQANIASNTLNDQKNPAVAKKIINSVLEASEYRQQVNLLVSALGLPNSQKEDLEKSLCYNHRKDSGYIDVSAVKKDIELIAFLSNSLYDINPTRDGSNIKEALSIYNRQAKRYTDAHKNLDQGAFSKKQIK